MNSAEAKIESIQLPPASEARHRSIAKKAAAILDRLADGNGLKTGQIKLSREETHIHPIPAAITARLATEVTKSRAKGKKPQGIIMNTPAEAMAAAEAMAKSLLHEADVRAELEEKFKSDAGQGFGLQPLTIRLESQRKHFSVITPCARCGGAAVTACGPCNGSGSLTCNSCAGNGFSNCKWCHGMGQVQGQGGAYVRCTYCQNGRVSCPACRGNRTLVCATCRGQGRIGCTDCAQTGAATEVYQVNGTASCLFEADWREVHPDVKSTAHKLGLRELATKGHAEIIWQPATARPDDICIPCVAFLPVSDVEFTAEGQTYPARVAGLRGRIVEIGPVLDKYVKPGITALMKLSKGPMARQALIDTACKYRLIRQVLAGLARESKKNVYQRLNKAYAPLLSDKYARATVKYAAIALSSLSEKPRYKGLAAGTALAALIAVVYYLSPLRSLLLTQLVQYTFVADIAVWLASWGFAIYTIRLVAAYALRKVLPETVLSRKSALPSAGNQGLMALLTTAIVCCIVAACAAAKPTWILYILGRS